MKKLVLCLFFTIFSFSLSAQQQNTEWAQEVLDFIIAGEGDSIYIRLSAEVQEKVSVTMCAGLFRMFEQQCGRYREQGEWKTEVVNGRMLNFADLSFERMPLRFYISRDDQGKINTLYFAPAPAPTEAFSVSGSLEEKEIVVTCGEFKLPGIVTLPKGKSEGPVVILVHGSGPQDRDETIGPNKPFRDIAWGLAEKGIAVIRYDKRTLVYRDKYAPEDQRNFDTETVDDALAAIELAKNIDRFEAKGIYIIGHSQGALLAPRIAERAGNALAGIVMIAAPARPLEDVILEQMEYLLPLNELPAEQIEQQLSELKRQVANVKLLGTDRYDETITLPMINSKSFWEDSNRYQPTEVAQQLTLPILIIQGERDYQVTIEDFALWKKALAGQPGVVFKSYPELNHCLFPGVGKGVPAEYYQENKVDAAVIDDIVQWLEE